MIGERNAKLRVELAFDPPRENLLHQIIQGSVVPMVNSGSGRVAAAFLGAQRVSDDVTGATPALRRALTARLREFLSCCDEAIALSASISTEKFHKFQSMVETQVAPARPHNATRRTTTRHNDNDANTHARALQHNVVVF